ncbi:EVE domain-containing protein [Azospirillum endophyticum]|uniref:EVE domain-containing protein n=1 Tax=Azospirillum endophyticum TaxID=2800326 RepID=UPI001FFE5EEC|nr:EVE domain-containing protein [Azospirillum endophyticum]
MCGAAGPAASCRSATARRPRCGGSGRADRVVYYSPTDRFGTADGLKSFTAIGTILPGEPYRFDMGGGFVPFRRNVGWWPAEETPIQPLLDRLELTAGVRNWGYAFRFGLLPVSLRDFDLIAGEMRAAARDAVAA